MLWTGIRLLDSHNDSIAEIHAEIEGPGEQHGVYMYLMPHCMIL